MTKIDLKDAYFLVRIDNKSKKYLRFEYKKQLYEFNVLPMGLCTAPFIFTKLLKPVIAKLRLDGVICVIYLDDILIISKNKEDCYHHTYKVIELLIFLGFIINFNKSILQPSKQCKYLGFNFNTINMTLSLPEDKIKKIIDICQRFVKKHFCLIKDFARLLGILTAACPAIKYGWAHTKNLERKKYLALIKCKDNYNSKMSITKTVRLDLQWWISIVGKINTSLDMPNFQLEIFSDASNVGWGGVCNKMRINGLWGQEEKTHHINYLELLATFNCLTYFTRGLRNVSILLRIDNTTAISYINRMGGVKYKKLNIITQKIWQYCETQNLYIFASYINSKENSIADFESRLGYLNTEYELNQKYFLKICNNFYEPSIDLFATNKNKKCISFLSWKPERGAMCIDAFTISWTNFAFYAFPPFSMVAKVLNKIKIDQAEGLLIVPKWPGQPWYPLFMEMLVKAPYYMGPYKDLIISSYRKPHPMWSSLILVAGHISGKPL